MKSPQNVSGRAEWGWPAGVITIYRCQGISSVGHRVGCGYRMGGGGTYVLDGYIYTHCQTSTRGKFISTFSDNRCLEANTWGSNTIFEQIWEVTAITKK